jgi:hypothetical protein
LLNLNPILDDASLCPSTSTGGGGLPIGLAKDGSSALSAASKSATKPVANSTTKP